MSKDFHGDYLPQVVSAAMENFDGMSHDRIIQYRDKVVPVDMTADVTAWNNLAKTTYDNAEAFRKEIEGLINNGWAGATADSAKNAVRTYAEDTQNLQNAAKLVASKLSDANATLTQVKGQIPDKPKRKSTSIAGIVTDVVATAIGAEGSTVGAQLSADHGRTNNAQNEARDVMKNVYAKYLPEADTNVPKMPGVTTANNDGATGPSTPASTAQSYAPTYTSNNTGYGTSNGSGYSANASDSSSNSGTSTNPSDYSGTSSNTSSSLNLPNATTGHSYDLSGSSYSPNSTTTAGYSPSGTGTTGTTGGGGYDSSTGGGAGQSVAGKTTGTTTPGATTTAATTAKSTTGMTGMPQAGQKGKGEGDSEHKTPDYLKGVQEELVGPEPRLLPGGVIGGDYAEE